MIINYITEQKNNTRKTVIFDLATVVDHIFYILLSS